MTLQERQRAAAEAGAAANKANAAQRAEEYRWFLGPVVASGASLAELTRQLNARRLMTPSGKGRWSRSMTKRLLVRLGLYQPTWPS